MQLSILNLSQLSIRAKITVQNSPSTLCELRLCYTDDANFRVTKILTTLPRSPMMRIATLDSDVERPLYDTTPCINGINIFDNTQRTTCAHQRGVRHNDSYAHSVRKMARKLRTRCLSTVDKGN